MAARITRAALQVVYLERIAPGTTPNTLSELLGYQRVRADGYAHARTRRTLDLRGRVALVDSAPRTTRVHVGADSVISTTVSANANDVSPAGLSSATIILADVTGAYSWTGLDSWCDERSKTLVNIGTGTLTLVHASSSSIADNRFALVGGADVDLGPNGAALIVRDTESARWRVKVLDEGDVVGGGGILDFSDEDNSGWLGAF
jgi:hypothetical protein